MAYKLAVRVVLLIGALACTSFAQGPWGTAKHLANVNSAGTETDPFITSDGLSLYFTCSGCGGAVDNDIWVSRRATQNDDWGVPENLGPPVNTPYNETQPVVSSDGQRLYFTSNRSGGWSGTDIWVSRLTGSSWGEPENLGNGVNSSANESQHTFFEDSLTSTTIMYFISDRGSPGLGDIYASMLQPDGTFSSAVPVTELNANEQGISTNEQGVSIRSDGLEIFFMSNRPGSIWNLQSKPSNDIWISTRASSSDPWAKPVPIDPCADGSFTCLQGPAYINTRFHDGGANISFDGMSLYFHAAQRPENVGASCPTRASTCFFDLWVATRPDSTAPNAPTPHLSPPPNPAGWNKSDVTVSFTSNGDAGPIFSGVSSCTGDQIIGTESAAAEVSGTCTDNAGNVSAPAGATVRLDKTPPVVTVTGVHDGTVYLLGDVPAAGCDSYDGLSGLASSATVSVSGGTPNGVGAFTATCNGAADIAGNLAAPKSASFTVAYGFTGFLMPLNSRGEFRAGSTIPVKWQLQNTNGAYVGSLSSVQTLRLAYRGTCSAEAGAAVDLGTSGNSGLRYDSTSNQFVFNWQTKGLLVGCYDVILALDDTTVHAATVSLR